VLRGPMAAAGAGPARPPTVPAGGAAWPAASGAGASGVCWASGLRGPRWGAARDALGSAIRGATPGADGAAAAGAAVPALVGAGEEPATDGAGTDDPEAASTAGSHDTGPGAGEPDAGAGVKGTTDGDDTGDDAAGAGAASAGTAGVDAGPSLAGGRDAGTVAVTGAAAGREEGAEFVSGAPGDPANQMPSASSIAASPAATATCRYDATIPRGRVATRACSMRQMAAAAGSPAPAALGTMRKSSRRRSPSMASLRPAAAPAGGSPNGMVSTRHSPLITEHLAFLERHARWRSGDRPLASRPRLRRMTSIGHRSEAGQGCAKSLLARPRAETGLPSSPTSTPRRPVSRSLEARRTGQSV
jgi:hypothetical protein